MVSGLFNNFFGIRIPVKTKHKIILGLVPIFLLIFLWYLTTSGRREIIVLPEGTFEGFEDSFPPIGTSFTKRTSLTIDNAKIEFEQKEERDIIWLHKNDAKIKLANFPVREMQDAARITLPPGKIIGHSSQEPAEIRPSDGRIESTEVDEVTQVASPPAETSKEPRLENTFTYKYEVVESRIFAPVILPSPMEVLRSLPDLWTERSLVTNILFSFLRVAAGFTVAFIIVFPLSLLMGTFSKFCSLFSPMMLFGAYLPIPALVPLTMVMFGTTERQKVMFLALGFAIYLLPLFVKALEEVDNVYLQTGYTLGAKKYQVLNKILLPIALPKIYDAMRLGFGIGWGYIILAEMVDMGSKGVGALILTSQRRGPREDIYLVLIAIVIMAFITDKIWEKVGYRLFPYRNQER
jgi:ABC-type nitrate/sulfonate/bicarbonate transport system permease component